MKITAWKAKDGKIFENEKDYINYECRDKIINIVESAQFLNVSSIEYSEQGDVLPLANLDTFILDNLDSFIAMSLSIRELKNRIL